MRKFPFKSVLLCLIVVVSSKPVFALNIPDQPSPGQFMSACKKEKEKAIPVMPQITIPFSLGITMDKTPFSGFCDYIFKDELLTKKEAELEAKQAQIELTDEKTKEKQELDDKLFNIANGTADYKNPQWRRSIIEGGFLREEMFSKLPDPVMSRTGQIDPIVLQQQSQLIEKVVALRIENNTLGEALACAKPHKDINYLAVFKKEFFPLLMRLRQLNRKKQELDSALRYTIKNIIVFQQSYSEIDKGLKQIENNSIRRLISYKTSKVPSKKKIVKPGSATEWEDGTLEVTYQIFSVVQTTKEYDDFYKKWEGLFLDALMKKRIFTHPFLSYKCFRSYQADGLDPSNQTLSSILDERVSRCQSDASFSREETQLYAFKALMAEKRTLGLLVAQQRAKIDSLKSLYMERPIEVDLINPKFTFEAPKRKCEGELIPAEIAEISNRQEQIEAELKSIITDIRAKKMSDQVSEALANVRAAENRAAEAAARTHEAESYKNAADSAPPAVIGPVLMEF